MCYTNTQLTFVYREVTHVIGSTYGRLKEAPDIESSALPVRSQVTGLTATAEREVTKHGTQNWGSGSCGEL